MNSKTFHTKIVALALLVATATGIALFPSLQQAQATQTAQPTTTGPNSSTLVIRFSNRRICDCRPASHNRGSMHARTCCRWSKTSGARSTVTVRS